MASNNQFVSCTFLSPRHKEEDLWISASNAVASDVLQFAPRNVICVKLKKSDICNDGIRRYENATSTDEGIKSFQVPIPEIVPKMPSAIPSGMTLTIWRVQIELHVHVHVLIGHGVSTPTLNPGGVAHGAAAACAKHEAIVTTFVFSPSIW